MAQDNNAQFQLNLFQNWQLFHRETEIHVPSRQQRLISALAMYGPRNRRYISGLLWPESAEIRALESLRVSVHLISRQTPGLLVNNGTVLALANNVSVDLQQCLEQVRACEHLPSQGGEDACLSRLLLAELLPGWYEDWVLLEQNRLRNVRLRALILHARRWLNQGEAEKAAEAAEAALALEPLQETCVGLLMQAELKLGNRAGALHTFESFRTLLAAELGVDPSGYLLELAADVRESQEK